MKFLNVKLFYIDFTSEAEQIDKSAITQNGIILSRIPNEILLLIEKLEDFLQWKNILAQKCFRCNYFEEYGQKRVLGQGAYSKVILAQNLKQNKYYAVKTFNKDSLMIQNKGKETLLNEIRILRDLDFEKINKLYEVFESENSVHLILEYFDGRDLIDEIVEKKKFFCKRTIKQIMFQLLEALQYIHSKGIIHRDLKPENVLLKISNNKVELQIIDFGLSTYMNDENIIYKKCGTPGYIAPEIINYSSKQNKFYDEKVDMFSLGVIFYILLFGKKPFDSEKKSQIVKQNKEAIIDFNFQQFQELQPSYKSLLQKLLEKDPAKRISAKQALNHEYFQSCLICELQQDQSLADHICKSKTKQNEQEISHLIYQSNKKFNLDPYSPPNKNENQLIDTIQEDEELEELQLIKKYSDEIGSKFKVNKHSTNSASINGDSDSMQNSYDDHNISQEKSGISKKIQQYQ